MFRLYSLMFTGLTWAGNFSSLLQYRVYGANPGWGALGKIRGNQGWWVNNSGIYKNLSTTASRGAEEASSLKTVLKFEKVAKGFFVATTVLLIGA